MFKWFKREKKPNPWRVIEKFWGGDRYIEELVEYPDTRRTVDLSVVNGNYGYLIEGFYHDGEWYCARRGGERVVETVVAWRQFTDSIGIIKD